MESWKECCTFSIEDGSIKVNDPVAHKYYDDPVKKHIFRNFEFKADCRQPPSDLEFASSNFLKTSGLTFASWIISKSYWTY